MFLRRYHRSKDGKTHTYYALVESVRTEAGPRQRVVAYLGELNHDEQRRWQRTVVFHNRQGDGRQLRLFPDDGDVGLPDDPNVARIDLNSVGWANPRRFGDVWLGLWLWRHLKLDEIVDRHVPQGKETIRPADIVAIEVINRLCAPCTEFAFAEHWYASTGLEDLLGVPDSAVTKDRLYRTLDRLLVAQEAIERDLKEQLGTWFQLDYSLVLYDLTSTYFEGQAAENQLARRGYSRDHRGDCKQIVVALIVTRDGFLFESPITRYAKDDHWGLSPAYETRTSRFDRPILPDCLFCHTNRVEPVTSAINRYRAPIFQRGYAIGCERCHGPGELQVRRPALVDGRDVTIVNPANLEPSLRDAVCEQCHLIGPRRVVRAHARSEGFRPGLPFYRFWSMYVPEANADHNRFASQPEQMQASRCFRASQGRLGCISCHDPHVFPTAEEKTAYFRERCLGCHADRGCSLPAKVRLERNGGDNCVGCHMPRLSSSNNPHVATTNHRIPRQADLEPKSQVRNDQPGLRQPALVNFHRALMKDDDLAGAERDRGIALCRAGGDGALTEALSLLKTSLETQPDDWPARECLGEVLGRLGRAEEGLAAYRMVLSKEPTRQVALEGAAYLAARASRPGDAIAYWRQAIAINPWRSGYFTELARVEVRVRDWPAAAEACQQTLRLNPSSLQVRTWLVQCYLHLGDRDAARREFAVLLGFDPPDRDALIRWFTPLAPKPSD